MSKPHFIVSIVLLLLVGSAFAAEPQKMKTQGPITVTAESLVADNKNHTATFEKNVIAKTSDMTIYADRMIVYYRDDAKDGYFHPDRREALRLTAGLTPTDQRYPAHLARRRD